MSDAERAIVKAPHRRTRLVRAVTLILLTLALGLGAPLVGDFVRERNETARTTARFDPPVWAGWAADWGSRLLRRACSTWG